MSANPSDKSDGELAAMALAGAQAAYGALMARHRDAVWRLAMHSVGDADAALDIVQETFVAAFAALGRYDGVRPFRAWIARITLNKCRDWGRRRAVRRFFAFARPIEAAIDMADAGPTPLEAAEARAELARVQAAIATLPATLREVLLLRTVEEMSQAQVADLLGVSGKAVETRLYRARTLLSERLEG